MKIANDTIITVTGKEHGKSGDRGRAFDSLKNGITVEAFRKSLAGKKLAGYAAWTLRTALAAKYIAFKAPKASKPAKAAKPVAVPAAA